MIISYIGQKEGGLEKLKGKKIGFIFLDAGYGREPIPLLEQLAKDYGFEVKLYPVAGKEMQDQSAQWLAVRRDRPAWMIMWGWGAMNPTAVKRAAENGFPMDHLVGVWWSGSDDDARPAGDAAKGYSALSFSASGTDFPVIKDIMKYIVDKGKSQVDSKARVGEAFYNRGVYNSMLVAEAIRNAQKLTGKKVVKGEDVRRGLESLNFNEARLKELGMEGLAAPVKVTCADHSGHHAVYVAKWDGQKYVKNSDWIQPIKEEVQPLIAETSKEYVEKNAGWPKRTEACDKSS
jgi:branched-chain amino acid transport system substrate-binding protein